jgi:CubicO group peptidase (beta-lactamase class C family)
MNLEALVKAPGSREGGDMAYDLVEATAADAGLSPERLGEIDARLAQEIEAGNVAGVVTLVARHGKIAHVKAQGFKNIAAAEPLRPDTIFRIFSMTKPVTGAAMMILHDEGKWSPDDPISKHWPAFEGARVLTGQSDSGEPITAPADHPPTMRELMTHSAGLSYGFSEMPIDMMYKAVEAWQAPSLAEFANRVASLPLAYQPGSMWLYSMSMDIQGAIIERLSGQSLADFFQTRLFGPLGMVDTGFFLPETKRSRLSTLYRTSRTKGQVEEPRGLLPTDYFSAPVVPSGGGGLVSTAHDYARFAQMLLNKGELGGVRILSPEAVALMSANHLPPALMSGAFGVGAQQMRPGFGHGFDCAVFTDPDLAGIPVGKGTFQWDGAAGTWFWIDPANDLIFVGMIQRMDLGQHANLQQLTQKMMAKAIL